MKKKTSLDRRLLELPLALLPFLTACLLSPQPSQVPIGNDTSIRFPEFHDTPAIQVGATGEPYQLDGVTLRAIMIAANDFNPPTAKEQPCPFRQEAQHYRVIRQGDILFVKVSYNPAYCQHKVFIFDGSARYAISTDGRILRRLVGIEPDGFPREERPDRSIPVPDSMVGSSTAEPDWEALPPSIRSRMQDAGIPDAGAPATDGGRSEAARDGGS